MSKTCHLIAGWSLSIPVNPSAGPGLRDLVLRWLRPDQGAQVRVLRRGRLNDGRVRYVEIETLSGGHPLAMFFFKSQTRPGGWAVVPDTLH